MNNCCCCSSSNENNRICPICKKQGQAVKNITVQNMIDNKAFPHSNDLDFFLCLNPKCDVAYFDNTGNILNQNAVRVPIWFKENANPKYICYCSKVTEEDIINSVIIKGYRSLKEVIEFTGAMKNSNCLINNPTGNCCHEQVKKTFESALERVKS